MLGGLSFTQFHYDYVYTEHEERTTWFTNAYGGLLFVFLEQPALSHTVLEEVDPVQIAALIGSIAGAWGKQFYKQRYNSGPDFIPGFCCSFGAHCKYAHVRTAPQR